MDPMDDMADRQEPGDGAAPLGPSARVFGKAALVVYWIVCLAVIAFGAWRMTGAASPPKPAPPPVVAAAQPAPVRTVVPAAAPSVRPAPPPVRAPAPPADEWAVDEPTPAEIAAPPIWAAALAVLSLGGLLVVAWRPWRGRGSRGYRRFSPRRLGSAPRMGFGRSRGF